MSVRILLTCEDYFPHVGGAEVCVHALKKEYERFGHMVTLYTNTIVDTEEKNVVRVPWRFTPLCLFKNIQILWKLIQKHDIVHCQYSFRLACLCAPIARLQKKPMVLTQQGRGIVPEQNPGFFQSLFLKLCQKVSMRGASILTATSDEIVAMTSAFVPKKKVHMISNGFDTELFSPNPSLPLPPEYARLKPGVRKILSVRRLVPKNGIHIFVQALALVRDLRQDFHYFVIGEGRVEGFIRALLTEFRLENHVTLLGKKMNEALPSYYQHADLVVIPSSAEARSIACIESMAMGKPLIASRVGGLIELLGKGGEYGTLVSIYDSEACTYDPPERLPHERLQPLTDAILSFLSNPVPYLEKADRAAAYARAHYSWDHIAQQYLDLYKTVLSSVN